MLLVTAMLLVTKNYTIGTIIVDNELGLQQQHEQKIRVNK